MARLRDQEDLSALCGVAGERLGVLPGVVEKDYWVAQALRALQTSYPERFVFKGGTSLSKAYGLIQRFSEDVDILVIRHERESSNARYKRVRQMTAVAGEAVGDPGRQENRGKERTGKQRTELLHYGPKSDGPAFMLPHIRLDIGIAPGVEPHTNRPIGTLLGDVLSNEQGIDPAEYEDLAVFDVPVLHPGRTLVEKLLLVHTAVTRAGTNSGELARYRAARHFYDIHCLLDHDESCALLADRDQFNAVLEEAIAISEKHFDGVEPRPADGFADSAAFSKTGPLTNAVNREYEVAMSGFYFGTGPYPNLDEIRQRVTDQRTLL